MAGPQKTGTGISLDREVVKKLDEVARVQCRSRSNLANMILREKLGLIPEDVMGGGK